MPWTGRILVIDDDPSIAALVAEVLTDEGYTVQLAYDGPDALAAIAAQMPDLVIADLLLPGMSGLELLHSVRERGHTQLPIIVMTAAAHRAADLTLHGAAAWITKPFDLDELLACVTRYVSPQPISIAVSA
jgi:DNA-binding response OmpR family regulator